MADPTPAAAFYRALRRGSRPRRRSLVAANGTAVAVLVGPRLTWWIGLLTACLIVIMLLYWDNRTGAISGSWLGDHGRHRLAATAARLERRGWTVLPAPLVSGQGAQGPTYVIIGPGGVFVVEHQIWAVTDTLTTDPDTGLLMVGAHPAARRTTQVRAAAAAVDEALTDTHPWPIVLQPVITIHGPTVDTPHTTIGVTILPVNHLARHLRHSTTTLSPQHIAAITDTASRLFAPT